MKRLFAAVLLTAVLSAQMSWAAGTEPPVDLNPAEEQTLLHVGREYRFYFTDAQGEIPDPEFWEGCTLEAELDEEEEREYTETFEVRADEAGRLYLAVELSPENRGLRTIRYKTAFENADGERWFAWNELKALFEPVDVQEEEIWIWYEEDCWPRDYDDDTVQYLNFTRQEVIFDPELEQVTLHFGNDAVYTVALGEERRFRLGCVTEPDQELRAALGDQAGEAEVVDFTGDPRFEAVGTLTLRSDRAGFYIKKPGFSLDANGAEGRDPAVLFLRKKNRNFAGNRLTKGVSLYIIFEYHLVLRCFCAQNQGGSSVLPEWEEGSNDGSSAERPFRQGWGKAVV